MIPFDGKPLLDRAWRSDGRLEDALTIGLLAVDATQASGDDVGRPLDTVLRRDGEYAMRERRFSAEELAPLSMLRSQWIARGISDAESVSAPLLTALEAATPDAVTQLT